MELRQTQLLQVQNLIDRYWGEATDEEIKVGIEKLIEQGELTPEVRNQPIR